jgi:hypothetical protein
LALRQRKQAELEQALEGASATRTRQEKEFGAKLQLAEQRAQEAAQKLQSQGADRKAIEAQTQRSLDELAAKHKAELDRRDQVKAQEVKRLQESVQEKSKQLKVVELELARYKNKPAGAVSSSPSSAGRLAPPPPAAKSPLQAALGDDDEVSATAVTEIPNRPAAGPAKPAAAAGAKPPPAKSPVAGAKPPAPAAKPPMPAPATLPKSATDDETDFTSIIDNLGD